MSLFVLKTVDRSVSRTLRSVLLAFCLLFGLVLTAAAQEAPISADSGEVIGTGLHGPQGVWVADDGAVWVIDSGLGGDTETPWISTSGEPIIAMMGDSGQLARIDPSTGEMEIVAAVPSIDIFTESIGGGRIAVLDGKVYVTVGQGIGDPTQPAPDLMGTVAVLEDGALVEVANLWDFERTNNPDPALFDTHPYGITPGPDGMLYVADAGANDLLRVDPATGEVSLVAVFEPIPGVFPRPDHGNQLLTDAVPTAVIFDEAGNAYVSYLSGAPFVPGSAKIVKVTPDGEVSDYAGGLTMLTDLRWGPDGEMYAIQFGIFTQEGPTPNSGALIHVKGGEESSVVIDGLSFPTSVAFNEAGDAYVAINGLGAPGSGAVVAYAGVAAPEAAPEATPEVMPVTGGEAAPNLVAWLLGFLVRIFLP